MRQGAVRSSQIACRITPCYSRHMMKTFRIVAVLFEFSLFALVLWTYQISTLVGIVTTVLWLGFAAGLSVMLVEPKENERPAAPPQTSIRHDPFAELVGSEAQTVSDLRPQGTVEILGKRYPARSLSGFITTGTRVSVSRSESGSLIVTDTTP